ncbi:MAG TPA: ankyrin repeat domain-containing protein [Chlamydiales bacterium]|nr:ankyrin repeat domain-containing protein [Chlamydiales bacterium]
MGKRWLAAVPDFWPFPMASAQRFPSPDVAAAYQKIAENDPLIYAAEMENMPAILKLIEGGAELNHISQYGGITPLGVAVRKNDYRFTKSLLDLKADPNLSGSPTTPVVIAAGHPQILQLLLERGAEVGSAEPIRQAASLGAFDSLKMLLNAGGDHSVPSDRGETAIDLARVELEKLALQKATEQDPEEVAKFSLEVREFKKIVGVLKNWKTEEHLPCEPLPKITKNIQELAERLGISDETANQVLSRFSEMQIVHMLAEHREHGLVKSYANKLKRLLARERIS